MHGQFRTVEGGTVLKVDESCSRRDAEERIVIRAVSGKGVRSQSRIYESGA